MSDVAIDVRKAKAAAQAAKRRQREASKAAKAAKERSRQAKLNLKDAKKASKKAAKAARKAKRAAIDWGEVRGRLDAASGLAVCRPGRPGVISVGTI